MSDLQKAVYVAVEDPDTIAAVSDIDCLSSEVLAVYQGKEVPLMVYYRNPSARNLSAKEAILKYMETFGIRPLNYRTIYQTDDKTRPFDEGFIVNGKFISSEKSRFSIDAIGKDEFIIIDQLCREVVCECTRVQANKVSLVLARLSNHTA